MTQLGEPFLLLFCVPLYIVLFKRFWGTKSKSEMNLTSALYPAGFTLQNATTVKWRGASGYGGLKEKLVTLKMLNHDVANNAFCVFSYKAINIFLYIVHTEPAEPASGSTDNHFIILLVYRALSSSLPLISLLPPAVCLTILQACRGWCCSDYSRKEEYHIISVVFHNLFVEANKYHPKVKTRPPRLQSVI